MDHSLLPRYVASNAVVNLGRSKTKTQDISPIRRQNTGNRRTNFKTKFEPHEKKTPSGMNTLSSSASL